MAMTSSRKRDSRTWARLALNLLICLHSGVPGSAVAAISRSGAEEAQIARCIREAARDRAWLERTLWGLRDQEAGWIGASVRNANGTVDLGPLQINSWWVPRMAKLLGRSEDKVAHWLRYDPCFNAGAARWIFLTAYRQTGNYWRAIGIYHSPTAWRQHSYALKVAGHLRDRFGQPFRYSPARERPGAPVGSVGIGKRSAKRGTVSVGRNI